MPGEVRQLGSAGRIQAALRPVQGGFASPPAASLNVSAGSQWARRSCASVSTECMRPGQPPALCPRARQGLRLPGTGSTPAPPLSARKPELPQEPPGICSHLFSWHQRGTGCGGGLCWHTPVSRPNTPGGCLCGSWPRKPSQPLPWVASDSHGAQECAHFMDLQTEVR